MACGPTCVAMAIAWVTGERKNLDVVTAVQKRTRWDYKKPFSEMRTFKDQVNLPTSLIGSERGTWRAGIRNMLRNSLLSSQAVTPTGIFYELTSTQLRNALKTATPKTPVIVLLKEPAHYVICRTKKLLNKYEIVDPATGLRHTAGRVKGNHLVFADYDSAVESAVLVTGKMKAERRRLPGIGIIPKGFQTVN